MPTNQQAFEKTKQKIDQARRDGATELDLGWDYADESTKLTELPESLGQLSQLQHLYLFDNQLTALPESLNRCERLNGLFLHGNEALGIPPEVLGPEWDDTKHEGGDKDPADPRAILDWYFQSRAEPAQRLNEAKMLLVGQGGVGKTSLVHYLIHNRPCNAAELPTEGINIDDWEVQGKKDASGRFERVNVHVWDFGGQEIMHATHQFFLTRRSLYLLVIDARAGEKESNIHYWLKIIQSYGGDSPVLVVVNKCDQHPHELNETRLMRDYPKNRHDFIVRKMMQFELAYQIDSGRRTRWLVPELLDPKEPSDLDWKPDESLNFQYAYTIEDLKKNFPAIDGWSELGVKLAPDRLAASYAKHRFRAPPAPGVHPRVYFNPEDLPVIRERLRSSRIARTEWELIRGRLLQISPRREDWEDVPYAQKDVEAKTPEYLAHGRRINRRMGFHGPWVGGWVNELVAGNEPADLAGKWHLNTPESKRQYLMHLLPFEAFRCLIEEDEAGGRRVAAALTTICRLFSEHEEQWAKTDNWQSIYQILSSDAIGLTYDWAYNFMTNQQRKEVRGFIATITARMTVSISTNG